MYTTSGKSVFGSRHHVPSPSPILETHRGWNQQGARALFTVGADAMNHVCGVLSSAQQALPVGVDVLWSSSKD
jgi:hypothetical protein